MEINKNFSQYSMTKLKGDGSDRSFYRLTKGSEKFILMLNSDRASNERYVSAYDKYLKIGIPIPKFIDYSLAEGFILFEDLGDMHLRNYLINKHSLDYLKKAIDIILKLQFCDGKRVTYHHSFTYDVFTFESNYAFSHYCTGFKNKPHLKDKYEPYIMNLNRTLAQASEYLTHRDYHPDNLMLRNGKIFLIDFQDTRLGPLTYDLVSLLYDRSTLGFDEIKQLKEYFIGFLNNYHKISRDEFEYLFTINSIQRMFKILGSFACLSKVKNNPTYLSFIPDTLKYLDYEIKQSPFSNELKYFCEDLV